MKLFNKKEKTLETLTKNLQSEEIRPIMKKWLDEKYDFQVTEDMLTNFVNAYLNNSTIKVCVWNQNKNTYCYMKFIQETRRNNTDSHYLYYIIGKKPTGSKWEMVTYPSKEDLLHFNVTSHQINVARQMLREQTYNTYEAFLPVK
jgi:hypothetical protein